MFYKDKSIEICLEGPNSMLRDLSEKEKEMLANNYISRSFRKGEVIFHEGEKPAGMYCLASGKVKVTMEGVGGRDQIIRMIKPQGLFGYNAVFTNATFNATAIALEETIVCIFNDKAFIELLKNNPELSLMLIKMMASNTTFLNERTLSLTQKHIRGRLAESLLVLKDTYGLENDGLTIKANVSREDLANLSNMTTSNAIRTLSMFAEENIIALEGKKIKILNAARLEKISQLG
jgi:CRP/FNR family transcriptional regulator, polysaccharide utilization system transcription regulator